MAMLDLGHICGHNVSDITISMEKLVSSVNALVEAGTLPTIADADAALSGGLLSAIDQDPVEDSPCRITSSGTHRAISGADSTLPQVPPVPANEDTTIVPSVFVESTYTTIATNGSSINIILSAPTEGARIVVNYIGVKNGDKFGIPHITYPKGVYVCDTSPPRSTALRMEAEVINQHWFVSITGTKTIDDMRTYSIIYHFNRNQDVGTTTITEQCDVYSAHKLRDDIWTKLYDTAPRAGWSITNGGSIAYANGAVIPSETFAEGSTLHLYPVWTPTYVDCTDTFIGYIYNGGIVNSNKTEDYNIYSSAKANFVSEYAESKWDIDVYASFYGNNDKPGSISLKKDDNNWATIASGKKGSNEGEFTYGFSNKSYTFEAKASGGTINSTRIYIVGYYIK